MLSQIRLSLCRLSSVTLVHPTQAVELFGIFFHHTIAQGLYFSSAKNRWWGRPFPLKFAFKVTHPLSNSEISTISAHSASTVIASEKSSISTYRKSSTRFPMSHRWTVYVTPKSPKGWHKNAISLFVPVKFNFSWKKVCYKVSLCENFQRQSCSYIIPLSNGP